MASWRAGRLSDSLKEPHNLLPRSHGCCRIGCRALCRFGEIKGLEIALNSLGGPYSFSHVPPRVAGDRELDLRRAGDVVTEEGAIGQARTRLSPGASRKTQPR